MIKAIEEVKEGIEGELGLRPQLEGVKRFTLYGGIELPFIEYRMPYPAAKVQLAFEGESAAWMIVYLDDHRAYASELDTSDSMDEAVMLLRAAIQGGVHFRRSILNLRDGVTIRGEGVNWYMEPFSGEPPE
jgi:hypothetical protein